MELAIHTHKPGATWSGERTDLLKALIAKRIPYSEISRRTGLSLGAICGKASRLGIGPGCATLNQRHNYQAPSKFTADREHFVITAAMEAEAREWRGKKIAGADLEDDHCRFVLGDPAQGWHCGSPRVPGKSYCRTHSERCSRRSIYQEPHVQAAAVPA